VEVCVEDDSWATDGIAEEDSWAGDGSLEDPRRWTRLCVDE
jgi:hypothetical protein